MRIDPVIALVDEIERAYIALTHAREVNDWPATRGELARIAALHNDLRSTAASTVVGAAVLLREAANLLPGGQGLDWSARLRRIAARFDDGERRLDDLLWLREAARDLAQGVQRRTGQAASHLIVLALRGAARPILLYRAVTPRHQPHETVRSETHA